MNVAMAAGVVALAVAFGANHSRADEAAEFYRGKRIDLYISSAPGGAYDFAARLIGRHLGKNLPGNPAIIYRNMPGGGGLSAANHLANVVPKDGLSIGMVLSSAVFEPLHGNNKARFDARTLNWLGSPTKDVAALMLWRTVPVETLADARKRGLTLAVSGGMNSTPAFYGRILASVFDLKIKLVGGYRGQGAAFLAMERGEVEGFPSVAWSSIKSVKPDWIREGKVKSLVYFGAKRHPELASVPFAGDLLKNDREKLEIMRLASAPLSVGRPVFAPTGVPAARVSALRAGIAATFQDAGYLAECKKQNLECNDPTSGEDLHKIVLEAYAAPRELVEKIKAINTAR